MKDRVNIDQIALLLMLVIAGGKFLSLPSILAEEVGHDSWLVMVVAFSWDFVCLCFLLWAIRLNKDAHLSVEKVLTDNLSAVGCKLIMAIFFVIYVCRSLVLLSSCYKMFSVTFDVNTNWIAFMLPIVALSIFCLQRGFNSVARVGQLLFGLIVLCVVALLVNPLTEVRWTELLPIGEVGGEKIISTAFLRSFWFTDYIFVYFLLDKIQVKRYVFAPIFSVFAVGAIITVLLNVVFVAIYGSFAASTDLAMSKVGIFSLGANSSGRWDWLTLSVWIMSVILKIVIFYYCAYKSIEKIFGFSHCRLNVPTICVITALMLLPMFVSSRTLVEEFVSRCIIPFAIVQFVLPLVYPFLTARSLRFQNKKSTGISENENCDEKSGANGEMCTQSGI